MDVQSSEDSNGSSSSLSFESSEDEMAPTVLQSVICSSDDGCDEEDAAKSQDQIQFSSELDEA